MLEEVIKSEQKTKIFRTYLQAFEPSGIKNLDFCLAVDEFRTNFFNPTYDSLAEAEKIYSKYLRPLNPGERGRSSHIDLYKRFILFQNLYSKGFLCSSTKLRLRSSSTYSMT